MKVCHSRMLVLVMGNQLQFSIDPFKINFIHSIEIASLAASQICFDGSNCNFTQKRNNLHNSKIKLIYIVLSPAIKGWPKVLYKKKN